jgi:hypothetical protein
MAYNSARTLYPLVDTRPKGAAPHSERERKAPIATEKVSEVLKFDCPYKSSAEVSRAIAEGKLAGRDSLKYYKFLEEMERRARVRRVINERPMPRYQFCYFTGYDKDNP